MGISPPIPLEKPRKGRTVPVVVERDGRPVAKIDAALRSARWGAQIAGVYVDPAWRGRGLGALAEGEVEAQAAVLAIRLDAARAGYRVGYDDPSHFSREYKKHFGEPPGRDVERMRHAAAGR